MTHFKLPLVGITILAIISCTTASSLAQDDEAYQEIFRQVAARGTEIQTGVFEATGEMTGAGAPQPDKGDLEFFCAFDFPEGKMRFDRFLNTDARLVSREYAGGQFVQTASEMITFPRYLKKIIIGPLESRPPGWIEIIDVRALGLLGRGDIMKSFSFETILFNYRKMPGAVVFEEPDGLLKVEWTNGLSRRACFFDKGKAYSVTRHTLSTATLKDGEPDWGKPREDHRITYEKRDDLWIPNAWSSVTSDWSEKVTIKWKSLNEAVDDKYFSVESLDTKRAERIVDLRRSPAGSRPAKNK
ncbi:hypothetical protein NA78x_002161 [Anatilimnocola sp. NA78]|uniref:hypothetical protein n=1 Tax=Anatilimnocola sp. NA78 TaxID=3415683 RepID=UPI003CE54958